MLKPKALTQVLGQANTGGIQSTLYVLNWDLEYTKKGHFTTIIRRIYTSIYNTQYWSASEFRRPNEVRHLP